MKLILSSCDFRNEKSQEVIMDNLPYPINKCRLLFIPNEKATEEAISGDVYYDRMQEFGFAKENVYVFDHNNPDKFRNLDIDVIYISGGNTCGTLSIPYWKAKSVCDEMSHRRRFDFRRNDI